MAEIVKILSDIELEKDHLYYVKVIQGKTCLCKAKLNRKGRAGNKK